VIVVTVQAENNLKKLLNCECGDTYLNALTVQTNVAILFGLAVAFVRKAEPV
jgi:hypothetical protein